MSGTTNIRIAVQVIRLREPKVRENGRRAKRRARLPPALGAVAYIQRQGLGQRRLERDGAALTSGVHDEEMEDEN